MRNTSRSWKALSWALAPGVALLMTGCGLVGTTAATGAGAAAEAEDAKQAKATEDRIKQQLDDAQKAAAQQRQQADQQAN